MSPSPVPRPVAAIHVLDRHSSREGDVAVAAAVDGRTVFLRHEKVSSRFEALAPVVEAVTEVWRHQDGGMVLYLGDSTVRALLADTADARPGLEVRSVVTGPALRASWEACRQSLTDALSPECPDEPEVPEWKARRVYATDASKQTRDSLVGIAAVGSTGKVQVKQVRAATVAEGEFAAIAMVLTRLKRSRSVESVDILTDSLTAARVLNAGAARPGAGDHERLCLRLLEQVCGKGVEVRVSWVRGHDGNALNELADRAAVAARRCGQWGQPTQGFTASIRAELRELLDTVDARTFVPATPLPREVAGAA